MRKIILLEEGQEMEARVTEIENRHQNQFKLRFKDGYENIFYTDVESGNWVEEDLGFTSLATEAGKQLRSFLRSPFHVPKILTWQKQQINGTVVCFGFFNFMNGNRKCYQIYGCNKKYMYTLVDMDNDEWQISGSTLSLDEQFDTRLAHRIIRILSAYTAKAE